MKRKLIFGMLVLLVLIVGYFTWFHKGKTLKFIPKNADFVILIDVKKASQQYILSLANHPSHWFDNSKLSENNGIKVPDFVQIFHLKNTRFTEWYSIFEISKQADFFKFLTNKGFKLNKNNTYLKDRFSIKIKGSKCLVGLSSPEFENTAKIILNSNENRKLNADQLINSSIGSISYLTDSQIKNFSIDLNDDNLEIKDKNLQNNFSPILSNLEKSVSFLKLELDSENIQNASVLLNKKLNDSANIKSVLAVSELELVNDKIISYSYDDNFNEVQKVSYQKIVQPNYVISLQSFSPDKTWDYFQNKKWINAQNQFTLIPFQPNFIKRSEDNITIKSTKNPVEFGQKSAQNYIFLRNSKLFTSSLIILSEFEKKAISNIDYFFYENKADNYYIKLKFKKEELPLILRW